VIAAPREKYLTCIFPQNVARIPLGVHRPFRTISQGTGSTLLLFFGVMRQEVRQLQQAP